MHYWNTAKNILCIRLDSIGDVIMTAPALMALKTADPQRRLTLMTSTAGATAVPLISAVDDLIIYDAPWLKATELRENSNPEFAMIERLRQAQFDAAVIFTVYSQNPLPAAFLCYLAGIPLRLAHCRENPYQLLTDWIKDPEPEHILRHEVSRQVDLVAKVGCTVPIDVSYEGRLLSVSAQALQQVQIRLLELGIDLSQPWVVIHPGATAASRRYPPESFALVARRLVQREKIQVVFTGTESEADLAQTIQQQMEAASHSLVGCLNLAELAALLKLTPLLISNNTAPVHIASALGTPVVDLYALTNLQHVPWGVPNRVLFHDVPCRLCYKSICPEEHHNCLRLVDPESVIQAVLDLFNQPPQKSVPAVPLCLT